MQHMSYTNRHLSCRGHRSQPLSKSEVRSFLKYSTISAHVEWSGLLAIPTYWQGTRPRQDCCMTLDFIMSHAASIAEPTTTPEPPAIFGVVSGRELYRGRAADSCKKGQHLHTTMPAKDRKTRFSLAALSDEHQPCCKFEIT